MRRNFIMNCPTCLLVFPLVAAIALIAATVWAQDDSNTYYLNPDWSPDGAKIAFESGLEGELSIYTIDMDGRNLSQLTNKDYNDESPIWSPDGNKIAFFSNRRERRSELPVSLQIYVMKADGTEVRRVTHEGPALEYNISWSPDGSRLAFQSRPEINPGVHSLYLINIDGLGRERITDGRNNDSKPQWSPDGKRILFVQSAAIYKFFQDYTPDERALSRGSAEIMILNLDDGSRTPITQNEVRDSDPSWNADGSEIYYFQHADGKKTLFRQGLGKTDAIAVADGDLVSSSGFVSKTRLSPNGRYLTYHKEVDGAYGIYIYDLDLNRERLLVGSSQ